MSAIIYWLAVRLYALVVQLASVFNPKARLFVQGRRQLLSRIRYALVNERRPRIWMHCASLGEFEQGRPLLEKLRQKYSSHAFILTFYSPSGYEVRKNYEGADYIFYLPTDSISHARSFLKLVQPSLCIIIKYEFWYFYLAQLASKGVPTLLVSAIFRKEQPFFQWYGRLHRRMLQCFTHIFVQDNASATLLQKIGVEHVSVAGDTRFDRVLSGKSMTRDIPSVDEFCAGSKVLVAGSTWPEDERLLLDVVKKLPDNWKLILVPHEVNESHITDIEQAYGSMVVKWSELSDAHTGKKVLIVDTVGMLLQLYGYAAIAWVGGGLTANGVHNVLEAAVYGIPVMHGPVYEAYLEARELLAANGSIVADKPEIVLGQLQQWEQDPYSYEQAAGAAENYVLSKTGATRNILYFLEKNLFSTP